MSEALCGTQIYNHVPACFLPILCSCYLLMLLAYANLAVPRSVSCNMKVIVYWWFDVELAYFSAYQYLTACKLIFQGNLLSLSVSFLEISQSLTTSHLQNYIYIVTHNNFYATM